MVMSCPGSDPVDAHRVITYTAFGGGKVGINTVYPQYALDVGGDVHFQNNVYCGGANMFVGGGGVENPYVRMSAKLGATLQLAIATTHSGAFSSSAVANDGVISTSNGRLILQTGTGSAAILVDTSGNVGVNNASPACALDVVGNAQVSGSVVAATASITGTLTAGAGVRLPTGTVLTGSVSQLYNDAGYLTSGGSSGANLGLTGTLSSAALSSSGYASVTGAVSAGTLLSSVLTAASVSASTLSGLSIAYAAGTVGTFTSSVATLSTLSAGIASVTGVLTAGAGVRLPTGTVLTGSVSQLFNDAGYLTTSGANLTLAGTLLSAAASITGTLTAGAGVRLPTGTVLTGSVSQLFNDAGYLTTSGANLTLAGTLLSAAASITGTLTAGAGVRLPTGTVLTGSVSQLFNDAGYLTTSGANLSLTGTLSAGTLLSSTGTIGTLSASSLSASTLSGLSLHYTIGTIGTLATSAMTGAAGSFSGTLSAGVGNFGAGVTNYGPLSSTNGPITLYTNGLHASITAQVNDGTHTAYFQLQSGSYTGNLALTNVGSMTLQNGGRGISIPEAVALGTVSSTYGSFSAINTASLTSTGYLSNNSVGTVLANIYNNGYAIVNSANGSDSIVQAQCNDGAHYAYLRLVTANGTNIGQIALTGSGTLTFTNGGRGISIPEAVTLGTMTAASASVTNVLTLGTLSALNATLTGTLNATQLYASDRVQGLYGTFQTSVYASAGSFSGSVTALNGSVTSQLSAGTLSALNATLTGTLNTTQVYASDKVQGLFGTFQTSVYASAGSFSGGVYAGQFCSVTNVLSAGTASAAFGTFSGAVNAYNVTANNQVTAYVGSFTGGVNTYVVTANSGITNNYGSITNNSAGVGGIVNNSFGGDSVVLSACTDSTHYAYLRMSSDVGSYTGGMYLTNTGAAGLQNGGRGVSIPETLMVGNTSGNGSTAGGVFQYNSPSFDGVTSTQYIPTLWNPITSTSPFDSIGGFVKIFCKNTSTTTPKVGVLLVAFVKPYGGYITSLNTISTTKSPNLTTLTAAIGGSGNTYIVVSTDSDCSTTFHITAGC